MNQMFRYISVLVMLLVSTMASAQSTIKVMTITNGTVAVDKSSASKGEIVTVTVTPGDGYYFQKENLEVVKTVNPSATRGDVPIASAITVSGSDPSDLSVSRIFEFTVPDDGYEFQVSAVFKARSAITEEMVTLSATNFRYNGSDQKPTVTVNGLTEGTDYTVSFAEGVCKDVGTYSVSVSGRSTYKGMVTKTFTISSADGSLTPPSAKSGLVYTGEAQDLITAGSSTTGTMQYSLDGANYSAEIPQGTDAKEYTIYYKVVANAGYSNVDPASFKVTIAPKTVSSPVITLSETSCIYDGSTKEPTVAVKDEETTIPASEYTVSYSNNTNVGTATVTITDKEGGNYIVSGSVTFEITAQNEPTPDDPTPDTPEPVVEEVPTPDGGTITTTTTTEKLEDGTEKETKVEEKKDAEGNLESISETIKETKTADDGSTIENTKTTKTDSDGNFVKSETIEEKKDADGNVEKTVTQAEVPEVSGDAVSVKDETTGKEENYYSASEKTQEKLVKIVSADVAFEENSLQYIQVVETTNEKVTKDGGKSESKSYKLTGQKSVKDDKMLLLGQKKGYVLKATIGKGKLLAFKKMLVKAAKSNTRAITRDEGDSGGNTIEIESGEDYNILEDGDLIFILKTTESDVEITSINITEDDDPTEYVSIAIGKSGKASYCGVQSLDFGYSDEVKAYIATGFDKDEGTIWLTRVKDVPAGVPVLIKGEANKTYDVPVTDSQNSYYTNMFVGNTSGEKMVIQERDGDMVNYYLSGDGTFKSVNKTANIGNNKCYLQLPETFNATVTGATQTVKIGSIGKASFAAPVDLDFTNVSGLKAFTATGYDKSTKTIWLTRVMKVQKGEGVLLKGDPNSYEIPSAAVQSSYENMFVGNTSGDEIRVLETSEDGSQTNYYLSGKDGSFVSVNGFAKIGNNKCYLALPTLMVAVSSTRSAEDSYKFEEPEVIKLPIDFKSIGSEGDGTTSIREVKSGEVKSEEWYTLQGQRVAKPGKGVYIHNGHKVVIK